MRYYTGDSPCIGCGKTGREKARLSKDSLCSDCRSTLRIGREVVEKRKLQKDLISDVIVFMTGLRYLSSGETDDIVAAFREFLESVSISEAEKTANCKAKCIGSYDNSYSRSIGPFRFNVDSADKLECLILALNQYTESVYKDGVKHGSNLLMRLNEGELTPDAFIKRVNEDRSY